VEKDKKRYGEGRRGQHADDKILMRQCISDGSAVETWAG